MKIERKIVLSNAITMLLIVLIGLAGYQNLSLMLTKLRMPSFVVTLAGLMGWLGLLLYLLRQGGTINLPFTGFISKLSDTWLPGWLAWTLAAGLVAVSAGASLVVRRLRLAAGLPVTPLWWSPAKAGGTGSAYRRSIRPITW